LVTSPRSVAMATGGAAAGGAQHMNLRNQRMTSS
jgi:hypothetical protein